MNTIFSSIKLSFKKNFIVKVNGIFVIIDVLLGLLSFFLFWMGMSRFSDNNIWKEAYPLFIGYGLISRTVFNFFVGIKRIENIILTGNLDVYLLKPYPAILMMILENANFLIIFINLIAGLGILFYFTPISSFPQMLLGILISIIATISIEFIGLSLTLLSFKFGRVQRAKSILESYKVMLNYPTVFFQESITKIFTAIIPISFVATIPTLGMYSKYNNKIYLILIINFICTSFLVNILWKWGCSIYDSKN